MIRRDFSQPPDCQLGRLDKVHESLGFFEKMWQLRKRVRRMLKRRLFFMKNVMGRLIESRPRFSSAISEPPVESLKAGDSVRVRLKEEIQATLNNWNQLKGCAFMEEMWHFCGTTQQVLKPIQRFLDERDYHVKKVRGTVILDGVTCQGTVDFGPCDRNCFFFWRQEWLEKIE